MYHIVCSRVTSPCVFITLALSRSRAQALTVPTRCPQRPLCDAVTLASTLVTCQPLMGTKSHKQPNCNSGSYRNHASLLPLCCLALAHGVRRHTTPLHHAWLTLLPVSRGVDVLNTNCGGLRYWVLTLTLTLTLIRYRIRAPSVRARDRVRLRAWVSIRVRISIRVRLEVPSFHEANRRACF